MPDPFTLDLEELITPEAFQQAATNMRSEFESDGGYRWGRALSALAGSKVAAAVSEKVENCDVLALFAAGWAKVAELQDHKNKSTLAPDKPLFFTLGKFKQEADLHPVLTFSALGVTSKPIRLTLTLSAAFDAVELAIRNAHITEAGGGICKLSAVLKYGKIIFPAKPAPVEYKLIESRHFTAPGLKIP